MHSRPSLQLFRRDRKNCKHFHHYLRDGGSAYISLIVPVIATVGVRVCGIDVFVGCNMLDYLQDLQVERVHGRLGIKNPCYKEETDA